MIYRLGRRFILVSALSILAVLILVYGFICILNIFSVNRNLDMLTDGISSGNGRFPDSFEDRIPPSDEPDRAPVGDFITRETRFSTRHFTVWFDSADNIVRVNTEYIHTVDGALAEEYAKRALKRGDERGWVSNYRYMIYDTPEGRGVVFVDGTVTLSGLYQSLLMTGIVLLASGMIVLVLIIVFSKRAMKPVAESYEKQKQFVTDANHELKTPLTLILTNLDIAESELGKNEWLEDIRSEAQRMAELVNQLVALSRMDEDGQKINEKELRLSDMVSDTVSEFESLSSERKKKLSCFIEEGICYTGDESLLRRLVCILMDNAVKYCDDGGEITVRLYRRRNIFLTVENTYSSACDVDTDRLFDRFYRADKSRTYMGGFGIGLSIAKSIVSKHRGYISAYKKDGSHIGFKIILKD